MDLLWAFFVNPTKELDSLLTSGRELVPNHINQALVVRRAAYLLMVGLAQGRCPRICCRKEPSWVDSFAGWLPVIILEEDGNHYSRFGQTQ